MIGRIRFNRYAEIESIQAEDHNENMINLVFVTNHMIVGGIEKALLNLVHTLDHKKYQIHLFLFSMEGELLDLLPPYVKIHCLRPESLKQSWKRGGVFSFLYGVVIRILLRLTAHDYQKNVALTARLCRFPENIPCDLLVSYSHLYAPFSWVTHQKITPKMLFIHQSWFNKKDERLLRSKLDRFQKIVCVSDAAKQYMDSISPQSAYKNIVIHNFLCPDLIQSLAAQPADAQMKHLSILTVARLREEKGCQFIPLILRKILDRGLNVYWYIIGGGKLYQELAAIIPKMNLQGHLTLLCAKKNPYPYIRMCDIYVQPSVHEGYGISVQEARILHKPIVASDIPPFRALIDSGVNGTLAPLKRPSVSNEQFFANLENSHALTTEYQDVCIDSFADAIVDLIKNREKQKQYLEWLDSHLINTDHEELAKLNEVFHELCVSNRNEN